jgi:hypothetical protein
MASRKLYAAIMALIALMMLGAGASSSCARRFHNFSPAPPSSQAAAQFDPSVGPPPVLELDELLAGELRTVSEDGQVVSTGAQYSPAGSGATGSSEHCLEVEGAALNLRAYDPGDYTYALFAQQVGDGMMGGGRDDEIPLSSFITVEPCTAGGGRDEEIPLSFYMGFADFSLGSWHWYGPFGDDAEAALYGPTMQDRFKSPNDTFYTCVLTASAGHGASSLPASGYVGALPFAVGAKSASVTENPFGVRVRQLATNTGLGEGTVPGVVTGVLADMDVSGATTLTWEANIDPDVTKYQVYSSVWNSSQWNTRTFVGEVNVPDLTLTDTLSMTAYTYQYEVVAVNDVGTGGPGIDTAGAPAILGHPGFAPTSGITGATINFAAQVAGSEPITYNWDFGTAASPSISADASPVELLGVQGEYTISLYVVNGFGSDTSYFYSFQVMPPGIGWHTQAVISAGSVGQHTSLAVIDGSYAAIACSSDSGLQFVMAEDYEYARTWLAPVIVESGSGIGDYCSLTTVGTVPALTYFGWDIRYRRADGYYGDTWGSPVTLAPLGGGAEGTSLCVVDGNPAATFFNDVTVPGVGLKFARANDAGGVSWGTPILVDGASAMTGYYSSLAVVNGNPAAAYYGSGLKYCRASDADGAAWGTPVVVDDGPTKGNFASLKVVGGRPAIAYYEYLGLGIGARLMYVRALDANGDAWGTPQALDTETGQGTGSWISLAVINGKPAVSYANDQTANLMYIRALDAAGTAWGAPEVVDGTGYVGGYTSLAELHGKPAISYWNYYDDDLMFACYY